MIGWRWRSLWSWPATTTSSRPRPTRTIRKPGSGDALFLPKTRDEFRALINLGLTDAVRADQRRCRPLYFLGLSGRRLAKEQRHPHRPSAAVAAAADRLSDAGIDRHVRTWEKPSDHVPVWIDLDIETKS